MATSKPQVIELINVHRVIGEKEVVNFLKNADHDVVEGWFYQAKRYGRSEFVFGGLDYEIIRNRDFSFTVRLNEEQTISAEDLA